MFKTNAVLFRALAATALVALPIQSMAALARPAMMLRPSPVCVQGSSAITLGPALAPFALLAASTITNVGNTFVTHSPGAFTGAIPDDLMGVWPGTAVTGFYPTGTDKDGVNAIYAAGFNTNSAIPMAAQGALNTAYNTAAGRAPTRFVSGDLSQAKFYSVNAKGRSGYPMGTLPPGVYKANSTAGIVAGNLTLDGDGNARSVFIFQIASAFTTAYSAAVGGNVILTNGALPCNVFWQVGSSATLGGATFYGNVLAASSITLNATTFTGRALAGNGAITIPVSGGSLVTNPGGK